VAVDTFLWEIFVLDSPDINIKADSYHIVETSKSCWKCSGETRVFALLLPPGHTSFEVEELDDEDLEFGSDGACLTDIPESFEWRVINMSRIIFYVDYLPDSVLERIHALSRHYFLDYSRTTESSYYMNHCECCGMIQGDFNLHCEPRGAFLPLYEKDASDMILHMVDEPIEAGYDGSNEMEYFGVMRRV
jgi:hypothetical protein